MSQFNIYCDESCHLENDGHSVMVLGCIKVCATKETELLAEFKRLRLEHHAMSELKWNTVSASRMAFYEALIDAFFASVDVSFRSVLVKNKQYLNHDEFNQGEHDNFYYKMVYYLLTNQWMLPTRQANGMAYSYRVFLDIKDSRGREKLFKLKQVFIHRDGVDSPFVHFQHIHSHDSFWIQLADFMMGAIAFKARGLYECPESSTTKRAIVDYLEKKSGYALDDGTPPFEHKFNIFDFRVQVPPTGVANV